MITDYPQAISPKHVALLTRGQGERRNRPEPTEQQIRRQHRAGTPLMLGLRLTLDQALVFGSSVRAVITNKDEGCGLPRAVWETKNFP